MFSVPEEVVEVVVGDEAEPSEKGVVEEAEELVVYSVPREVVEVAGEVKLVRLEISELHFLSQVSLASKSSDLKRNDRDLVRICKTLLMS